MQNLTPAKDPNALIQKNSRDHREDGEDSKVLWSRSKAMEICSKSLHYDIVSLVKEVSMVEEGAVTLVERWGIALRRLVQWVGLLLQRAALFSLNVKDF